MGKKPSYHQTSTFLCSNCPKNPKVILVCQFNVGWIHFTSYMKKEWKKKEKYTLHQNHIKTWFDKKSSRNANFDVGDLVLKWDKPHEDKGKHTKFQSLWIFPYIVHEKLGPHTICNHFTGGLATFISMAKISNIIFSKSRPHLAPCTYYVYCLLFLRFSYYFYFVLSCLLSIILFFIFQISVSLYWVLAFEWVCGLDPKSLVTL